MEDRATSDRHGRQTKLKSSWQTDHAQIVMRHRSNSIHLVRQSKSDAQGPPQTWKYKTRYSFLSCLYGSWLVTSRSGRYLLGSFGYEQGNLHRLPSISRDPMRQVRSGFHSVRREHLLDGHQLSFASYREHRQISAISGLVSRSASSHKECLTCGTLEA